MFPEFLEDVAGHYMLLHPFGVQSINDITAFTVLFKIRFKITPQKSAETVKLKKKNGQNRGIFEKTTDLHSPFHEQLQSAHQTRVVTCICTLT